MLTTQGFDHVGLAVSDVEASARFYTDILGFRRMPPAAGHPVLVQAGTAKLALVPLGHGEMLANARGEHIAVVASVADRLGWLAELERRGVTVQDRGERAYLADPDGHVLEVCFRHP